MAEEAKRLRAELQKLRDELSRSQAEAQISKDQLEKARETLSKLERPDEEEVRQRFDQQQTEVRRMIGERYPGCRIDRLYYDGLEMPDFEQPIRARYVFTATGPDGKVQSGELPVWCDFSGRCSFGEMSLLADSGEASASGAEASGDAELAGANGTSGVKPPITGGEAAAETASGGTESAKRTRKHGMHADKEYDLSEKMKKPPLKFGGAGAVPEDTE